MIVAGPWVGRSYSIEKAVGFFVPSPQSGQPVKAISNILAALVRGSTDMAMAVYSGPRMMSTCSWSISSRAVLAAPAAVPVSSFKMTWTGRPSIVELPGSLVSSGTMGA